METEYSQIFCFGCKTAAWPVYQHRSELQLHDALYYHLWHQISKFSICIFSEA